MTTDPYMDDSTDKYEAIAAANARICELEADLKAARETIADLRDADKRAVKIAAEECDRQKAELEAVLNRIADQVGHPRIAPGELGIESVAEAVERHVAYLREREETLDSITPENLQAFAASEAHHDEHHQREAEIEARLAEAEKKLALDDPEFDATDAAHPAWWRGHDHTAAMFKQKVEKLKTRAETAEGEVKRLRQLATEYMEAEKAYRVAHDRGKAGPGLTLRANKADAALRAALSPAEQPEKSEPANE